MDLAIVYVAIHKYSIGIDSTKITITMMTVLI